MMGTARIAGYSLTLSGAYGADGLTVDYEKLPVAAQSKLTEVPPDVAQVFWKGEGGHNSAGSEWPSVEAWALAAFKGGK